MVRFIFIAFALLWSVPFASAQSNVKPCYQGTTSSCNPGVQSTSSVPISISSSTTTQLVALVANKAIFVTSWDIMAADVGTFKLVYGTGSSCGTGQHDLTGAYPLTAQAGISKGDGLGFVLFVPPGNAICAVTVGAVQYSGSLSYAQFQ